MPYSFVLPLVDSELVPTSFFLVRNMDLTMPTDTEDKADNATIASMVISAQVDERGMDTPELVEDPVKIMFQFDPVDNMSRYMCAYWKFSKP